MRLLRLWLAAAAGAEKNPRPCSSRGFLPKFNLVSTSAYGVAYDDDYQSYLSNFQKHCRAI
jgi:hypothetical protein